MNLELYHNSMSTCSQKVRITLAEKKKEFTSHHLNLRARDQHTADYLNLNPNGVVPTLVHNSLVIYESAVIDEYLDDIFPDFPLRSSDPYEKSLMRRWVKQLDEGVHAASATVSACIAFRYQFIEGKTSEELEQTLRGYVDPEKRKRMTENVMEGVDSSFFKPAIMRIVKMLNEMELVMKNRDWMAGREYSLADVAFTPYLTRLVHLQQDWLFDSRPRVADWFERVSNRPSYEVAMQKWFNLDFLALMEQHGADNCKRIRKIISAIV